ncbi:DNA-directed DNA polymerase [Powellomyces hirtus]|uniref:DNA-directed DNA polymerase n=1 Tax=Powellomyces hirtus TaxID=109895 RepID=A0A507E281_9FUNG|nr:DNA-directed DNA polymerase [Powellomyces hirtus]
MDTDNHGIVDATLAEIEQEQLSETTHKELNASVNQAEAFAALQDALNSSQQKLQALELRALRAEAAALKPMTETLRPVSFKDNQYANTLHKNLERFEPGRNRLLSKFLDDAAQYHAASKFPEEAKTNMLKTKLSAAVTDALPQLRHMTSWTEIDALLRRTYFRVNQPRLVLEDMIDLKQKGTIEEYVAKFDELLNEAGILTHPNLGFLLIQTLFIRGLSRADTRGLLAQGINSGTIYDYTMLKTQAADVACERQQPATVMYTMAPTSSPDKRRDGRRDQRPHPYAGGSTDKICHFCQKAGHLFAECRSLRAAILDAMGRSRSPANMVITQPQKAYMATLPTTSRPPPRTTIVGTLVLAEQALEPKAFHLSVGSAGTRRALLESGASRSTVSDAKRFDPKTCKSTDARVLVGNGAAIAAHGTGTLGLPSGINLPCSLHVPEVTEDLISTSQLADAGIISIFTRYKSILLRQTAELDTFIRTAPSVISRQPRSADGLYPLFPLRLELADVFAMAASEGPSYDLWHRRLGHPSPETMRQLAQTAIVPPHLSPPPTYPCATCLRSKAARHSYPDTASQTPTFPFEIVTSDVNELPEKSYDG